MSEARARMTELADLLYAATEIQTGFRYITVLMTADLARWLLEHEAPDNRSTVAGHAYTLTQDMLAGRFLATPVPVIVGTDGLMFDGGHRTRAFLRAVAQNPDVQVPITLVLQVPPEVRGVIDQGRTRSAAHLAQMLGQVENSARKSAIANLVLRYEKHPKTVWASSNAISKVEIAQWVVEHDPKLSVLHAGPNEPRLLTKASFGCLGYLVGAMSHEVDLWDEFVSGIRTGANLPAEDARLVLRTWTPSTRWGAGQSELGALIKAWNAYAADRPMKSLRFIRAELPMPEPV